MKVLVIGGTQFIGQTLVKELLRGRPRNVGPAPEDAPHDLGKKVANIMADRNDPESLKRALAGKNFDVVFDNVYDWERGTTATQVEATARACGNNLQRYIFMSSVAAYGDGLNHHEGDALAPDDHPESYVRNKAMSERALFRMHQRIGFPVVTLRPPFIYGPGNPFYREAFFWDRLRAGRPIILPGDGRRLMQFVYIKDLVTASLKVMDVPETKGTRSTSLMRGRFRRWRRWRPSHALPEAANVCPIASRANFARRRASHGSQAVFRHVLRCARDYAGDGQGPARTEIQTDGFRDGFKGDAPVVSPQQSVFQAGLFVRGCADRSGPGIGLFRTRRLSTGPRHVQH